MVRGPSFPCEVRPYFCPPATARPDPATTRGWGYTVLLLCVSRFDGRQVFLTAPGRVTKKEKEARPPSSSGLGRSPLTAKTGVRVPLGVVTRVARNRNPCSFQTGGFPIVTDLVISPCS